MSAPGIPDDLQLAALLMLTGLRVLADENGEILDRVDAADYPHPGAAEDVEEVLEALRAAGRIERFERDGSRWIRIPGFAEHHATAKRTPGPHGRGFV